VAYFASDDEEITTQIRTLQLMEKYNQLNTSLSPDQQDIARDNMTFIWSMRGIDELRVSLHELNADIAFIDTIGVPMTFDGMDELSNRAVVKYLALLRDL